MKLISYDISTSFAQNDGLFFSNLNFVDYNKIIITFFSVSLSWKNVLTFGKHQ